MDSLLHDAPLPDHVVSGCAPGDAAPLGPDRAALGAIRLLFDRNWYLERHPDVAGSGIDPFDHFLSCGLAEGRSPCPLFDPGFYLVQPGAPDRPDFLFLHYLDRGVRDGIAPHPLLDPAFYRAQAPVLPPGIDPLTHMLGPGRRGQRRPNPLFDPGFYRRQAGRLDPAMLPLVHYVLHGWRAGLAPHALFDPTFYGRARPDVATAGLDPLAHYLHSGHREGVLPTSLFDPAHYLAACAAAGHEPPAPERALLHCAAQADLSARPPIALFDAAHYLARVPDAARSGLDPFLHFVEFGLDQDHDPHPLFDTAFYRERHPDVADSGMPPFLHYVRHGAAEGRDPNRFFPVAAYLRRCPDAAGTPGGALAHFLAHAEMHRERLGPGFDPNYYQNCHPDCAAAARRGVPPLSHYLSVGMALGLSPVPDALDSFGWSVPDAVWPDAAVPGSALLLVLEEASHGEDALCALRAVEQIARDPELRCHVVIRRGGPLGCAIASLAPTLVLTDDPRADGRDPLAAILHAFAAEQPDGVVMFNSAALLEPGLLAARLGLRLVLWLHEMPVTIDGLHGGRDTVDRLAQAGVLFLVPSAPARNTLLRHYALPADRVAVAADGVAPLPPHLDARMASLALREALDLPPDALVVLGRGAIDVRGGADLFVRVASLVVARAARTAGAGSALHQAFFVWIGEASDPLFAALCRHDVERLGLGNRVRMLDPREEPPHSLPGADLFLLTARDGASAHGALEARSHGLRVVAFENSGAGHAGAQAGMLVEVGYLDLEAMAEAIMVHGDRPARRTRDSLPAPPAGPDWSGWHARFRALLPGGRPAEPP